MKKLSLKGKELIVKSFKKELKLSPNLKANLSHFFTENVYLSFGGFNS